MAGLIFVGILLVGLTFAYYVQQPTKKIKSDKSVGEFVESLSEDQQMKLLGLCMKYEDLDLFADYMFEKVDADWKKQNGLE